MQRKKKQRRSCFSSAVCNLSTNTHRRRPTVKKRLQVCRGIHLCVWYLSSSVPFWSDGFHKLHHEVRAVIFFSRDSVPAQISAGVSNPFECGVLELHFYSSTRHWQLHTKPTRQYWGCFHRSRVRKWEHFSALVGFRVGQHTFVRWGKKKEGRNWFDNKSWGDQDVCARNSEELTDTDCSLDSATSMDKSHKISLCVRVHTNHKKINK